MNRMIAGWVLMTSVALGLLGCGGSSSTGGNPNAGGAAGAGTAGYSGGVSGSAPVPAQGSLRLAIGTAPVAEPGFACPLNKMYLVGNPAPSDTMTGAPLIDGQGGASIVCSVTEPGQSFVLNATLSAPTSDGQSLVHFALNAPSVTATTSTPSAQGSVYTSELTDTLVSSTSDPNGGCTVDVLADQVKPGAVWAKFNCPSLTAAPSTQCAAAGEFVFQNCAQN